MTDEELVKRLRSYAKDQGGWHNIDDTCEEAADRIEALTAELTLAEQRGYANAMEAERKLHEDRIKALTAERDEHWKSFVHWRKEADALTEQLEAARADAKEAEAYAEGLEAKLATCEEIGRAFEEDAGQLRAKLEKAVELLKEARQDLEEYVTHEWPKDEHPVYERKWERDMELCRRIDATLAEIEGEKT
jgi:chromosome segregation ATPase